MKPSGEVRRVQLNGVPVEYTLYRKKVKNLNLRVRADGSVVMSAPYRVPVEAIETFLLSRADFVLGAMEKMKSSPRTPAPQAQYGEGETVYVFGEAYTLRVVCGAASVTLDREARVLCLSLRTPASAEARRRVLSLWMKERCAEVIGKMCDEVYPRFRAWGVARPEVKYRKMVSRWGSCQPAKGVLTFNTALAGVPLACAEYVVYHEFTHFLHPNHSPRFYARLSEFLPDWRARKDKLNSEKMQLI